MRRRLSAALLASLTSSLVGGVGVAHASGLYFSERGVRPLGRGGAFVAGADDLGAIYHNPAGIFDAGSQFLLDASWLNFSSDYTRQARLTQVDPNTGQEIGTFEQTYSTVEGTSPVLPIPTLAGSYSPHEDWMLAIGTYAPYTAITSYPSELDGGPAPQRYALVTLDGSALVILGAWVAWRPIPELRIGAGIEALAGSFNSTVYFTACVPDRFLCAPQQPDWDAYSELNAGPIFAPSGNIGALYDVTEKVRVGAAFQLPYWVRAPATVRTRLPAAAPFQTAEQNGEDASVSFNLPWQARIGVEARDFVEDLRVELSLHYDAWSMHDEILVETDGISLDNVAGFPPQYLVPDVAFPRNFQDTVAVRLGGEYMFPFLGERLQVRAGFGYETSAVPNEYLTVLTIDAPKITTALGTSLYVGQDWRFDMVFAHIFAEDVLVTTDEARVEAVNPVDANSPERPNYINAGLYESRANVFGVGLTYQFEESPMKRKDPAPSADPVEETEEEPTEEDVDAEVGSLAPRVVSRPL